MSFRYATPDETAHWNELLLQNPDYGNVFQMVEVANTKRRNGWKSRYVIHEQLAVTVLEKSVWPLGKFWYLPKGPGVTQVGQLRELLPELKAFAGQQGVFAVKIEPEINDSPDIRRELESLGLVATMPPVQPNASTVIIDLSPPLDDVLKGLNQKGRHALRRAERDGVVAEAVPFNDTNARVMYDLLRETATGRFEVLVRDFEYYQAFWKAFTDAGQGSLFFARYDGRVVAAAFSMYHGKKGLYKDGASLREKTTYGASHLLQWEIMKWMKARGVESYDLCGTTHSSRINDESHNFYGVGRFKTSFNKTVTDYVGCYDLPVRPLAYRLWQLIIKRVVISLAWRLRKRLWF